MSINPLLYTSQDNSLEILVQSNKIIYSVLDENDVPVLRQEINMIPGKSADSSIYEHYFNQPELNIPGDNVRIVFENNLYQLVPSTLFREEAMQKVFEVEHGERKDDQLSYLVLPKWGVHFVFAAPQRMSRFFDDRYPDAAVEHHMGTFLKRHNHQTDDVLYAQLRYETVDLILIRNRRLELLSSQEVSGREDISYFILNVYEQQELDTASFPLKLIFPEKEDQELIEMLAGYIENVKKV